ncbi:Transposase [Neochlamydia sp. S13]|jgi:hypothetical protein|nr:Transposase [Neochlamydia sp. S13]
MLTPENVETPVCGLSRNIFGKMFADKGCISSLLFIKLYSKDLEIITGLRKNMNNKLMSLVGKILLRKRGIIERLNDKLKNSCQIEHHRYRSPWNFFVNLISGIVTYAYEPCKPCIQLTRMEKQKLMSWLTA